LTRLSLGTLSPAAHETLGNPPTLVISENLTVGRRGVVVPHPHDIIQYDPDAALAQLEQSTNLARLAVALSPTLACTELIDTKPKPDQSHRNLMSCLFGELATETFPILPLFETRMQWILREAHFENFLRNVIEREPFRYWDKLGDDSAGHDMFEAVQHVRNFDRELFGEIENALNSRHSDGNSLFRAGRINSYALESLRLLLKGVGERRHDQRLCQELMTAEDGGRYYFVLQSYDCILRKVGPDDLRTYYQELDLMLGDMNRFAPQHYRDRFGALIDRIATA
jgi:hypothetical protein